MFYNVIVFICCHSLCNHGELDLKEVAMMVMCVYVCVCGGGRCMCVGVCGCARACCKTHCGSCGRCCRSTRGFQIHSCQRWFSRGANLTWSLTLSADFRLSAVARRSHVVSPARGHVTVMAVFTWTRARCVCVSAQVCVCVSAQVCVRAPAPSLCVLASVCAGPCPCVRLCARLCLRLCVFKGTFSPTLC